MSRGRRTALALVVVALVAPAVAEVAARALEQGPADPVGTAPGMFVADAERGYALRPGWRDERRAIAIGGDGLRARGGTAPPATPTARVLAVGDGQTFGLGVAEHEAWPRVLETTLGTEGHAVEVINAGTPGYHAGQAATHLEALLSSEAPDLVLWSVYVGNDVAALWSERDAPRRVHAGMLVEPDGRPLLGLRTWLHRHSRAWRAWAEPLWREQITDEVALRQLVQRELAWDPGFSLAQAAIHAPEGVEEAWGAFEATLARVRAACDAAGARLHLVLVPAPLQYDAALWLEVHGRTRTDPAEYDLDQPSARLRALAEATGTTLHDPTERLAEWSDAMTAAASKPYLGYQLSVWGHRLVAQDLAEALAESDSL